MTSQYRRVIPRDLFNESKLLKCIGKISLLIHEQMIQGLNINHEDSGKGFIVRQHESDGSIFIENVHFFDNNGTPIYFSTALNSRDNWPLEMEYKDEIYYPINDDGKYQLDKNLFKGDK